MDNHFSSSPHFFTPELGGSSTISSKSINLEKHSHSAPVVQIPSIRNYGEILTAAGMEPDLTSPDVPSPLARARCCDVYIGYNRQDPPFNRRLVKWLTAELEMHASVFATDRNRNKDAISHCAARVAMEVAPVGIVVVTVQSLSDAFRTEEMLLFSQNRKLVPVFVGLTRNDCVSSDVIQKNGDLWSRFGGELWKDYGGREEDWKEVVDGLSRVDMDFEASAANLRDCLLDIVAFIGKRLGKRSIIESIQKCSESGLHELPFSRNENFIGRKQELRQLEFILFGYIEEHDEGKLADSDIEKKEREKGKGKMPLASEEQKEEEMSLTIAEVGSYARGIVCINGETGIGKTELLLEFAYRHMQRYKAVFWIGGEARFLRENYMKLSGPLSIEAGIDNGSAVSANIEEQAIGKVRKEFTRDIPYLIVIDNLEMEKDFWDGRPVSDLLPPFTGQTHVLISTRLPGIFNIMTFKLPYPSPSEAMNFIKGDSSLLLASEDDDVLNIIQEKLRRLPFGLLLVRAILSQLAIDPQTLLALLDSPMAAEITYGPKDDPVFQYNPFLIQLLDVCFSFFNQLYKNTKNLAMKMVEASSWFGPSPVPVCMLAYAAWGSTSNSNSRNIWKKLRDSMFSFPCMGTLNAEGKEAEALSMLMRLGIARSGTRPGHVHFHDIFKLYMRQRSSAEPSSLFVQAITDEGFSPAYTDHVWAACFLVLKFGMYHHIPIDLGPHDLLFFINQLVIPLVAYSLNELSLCSAVLDLLRVATQRLELLENSLLEEAETARKMKSIFGGKSQSFIESEPTIIRDIVTLRAAILETRAKIMIKTGRSDVAEDLCRTAINIKEVIYGVEHAETQLAHKIMDLIARVKSRF
ncbi:Disease resistance protein (TIR-NBS class) [Rhynchospora pubera]|uniref:Disease resistance protein (TIR-NBS class) n=1 Tax=Rhynchospora pubera TaxID=906938 RepID=A0AAV8FK13_9POAL|nr:Disease resistance protein (TIR-NBS class) [Rhynchospora pubera]